MYPWSVVGIFLLSVKLSWEGLELWSEVLLHSTYIWILLKATDMKLLLKNCMQRMYYNAGAEVPEQDY